MPNHKTFEERYPTIHRFVEEIGWIEIGQDSVITSLLRGTGLIAYKSCPTTFIGDY